MKVYFWPDGTWCIGKKELCEMLTFKSDDYGVIELDDADAYEDHQISAMVDERIS